MGRLWLRHPDDRNGRPGHPMETSTEGDSGLCIEELSDTLSRNGCPGYPSRVDGFTPHPVALRPTSPSRVEVRMCCDDHFLSPLPCPVLDVGAGFDWSRGIMSHGWLHVPGGMASWDQGAQSPRCYPPLGVMASRFLGVGCGMARWFLVELDPMPRGRACAPWEVGFQVSRFPRGSPPALP